MANYPQELAQDAVCQSHTAHMTGLWFLPARPLRLKTNELTSNSPYVVWTDRVLPCHILLQAFQLQVSLTWLCVCSTLRNI